MDRPAVITNLDDPELDHYRDLKKTNFTRRSTHFIAEGRLVTQRLLQSSHETESVLITESKWESMVPFLSPDTKTLCVTDSLANDLVGFQFHAGVMGCGKRTKCASLSEWKKTLSTSKRVTLVAVPETSLPDNLGSIVRICAAFGCDGLIVGNKCADVFSRRVIRVSMGNVFSLPILEPDDFAITLQTLKDQMDFELIAATLNKDASPLEEANRELRSCLLFGNEANGLDPQVIEGASREVTLRMDSGIDSLNVAHAATVFLYHFTRLR